MRGLAPATILEFQLAYHPAGQLGHQVEVAALLGALANRLALTLGAIREFAWAGQRINVFGHSRSFQLHDRSGVIGARAAHQQLLTGFQYMRLRFDDAHDATLSLRNSTLLHHPAARACPSCAWASRKS